MLRVRTDEGGIPPVLQSSRRHHQLFAHLANHTPASDEHALSDHPLGYSKYDPRLWTSSRPCLVPPALKQPGGIPFVSKHWTANILSTRIFQERAEHIAEAFKTTPSPTPASSLLPNSTTRPMSARSRKAGPLRPGFRHLKAVTQAHRRKRF